MKANRALMGLGMIAGVAFAGTNAMAVFIPPQGETTHIKLVDATSFYDSNGNAGWTPAPRGTSPTVGDQDFTAFRLSEIQVDSQTPFLPATELTGIVTFLQYGSTFSPFVNPDTGNPDPSLGGTAKLIDSSRTHTVAADTLHGATPHATLGRFFLFDTGAAPGSGNVATFDTPGGRAGDVQFDQSAFGYNIDTLANFTQGTLLATGSIVDNDGNPFDGQITQVFFPSPFQSFGVDLESVISGPLVLDGGAWYDAGIREGSFSIHLYTIQPTATAAQIEGGPIRPGPFGGNWLASSEDPVTVINRVPITTGVPEPVTASLGSIALIALGGYATRRRKA